MPTDSYFNEALKKLVEVSEQQEAHWRDLPRMLDRSATNFALKANEASKSAVEPIHAMLHELKAQLCEQGATLLALKEETGLLARKSSFHERDMKELRRELEGLKTRVGKMEERLAQLADGRE